MERHEIATLEVEVISDIGETEPLAGQGFYILDSSASDFTMGELRSEALKFFITDSQGKARIEELEAGTYYICGVGETRNGIWNVRVDLKPGKNSLILGNKNTHSE